MVIKNQSAPPYTSIIVHQIKNPLKKKGVHVSLHILLIYYQYIKIISILHSFILLVNMETYIRIKYICTNLPCI